MKKAILNSVAFISFVIFALVTWEFYAEEIFDTLFGFEHNESTGEKWESIAFVFLAMLIPSAFYVQKEKSRNRAEEALKNSEARYRNLVEGANVVSWEFDWDSNRFTFVSEQATKVFGFPHDQWYQTGFWQSIIHPDDRESAVDSCKKASMEGRDHELEYRIIGIYGEVIWINDIVHVESATGEPVKLVGVMVDITEKKQIEIAFKQVLKATSGLTGDKLLNSLVKRLALSVNVEYAFVAEVVPNKDNHVRLKSLWAKGEIAPTFEYSIIDTPCENVVGKKLAIYPSKVRELFPKDELLFEFSIESYLAIPFSDSNGAPLGHIGIMSERAMLNSEFMKSMVVVYGLLAKSELLRMKAEEENNIYREKVLHTQKLESMGVLAGGIAHDFNNLLTSILGNASMVKSELPANSMVNESVNDIITASIRAAELSKQMLAYSGRGRFVIESVDLNEIVCETMQLIGASISKKIEINYELSQDMPLIDADTTQIRQVIMNLITNASEAIGEKGGAIDIATKTERCDRYTFAHIFTATDLPGGRYVSFEIKDTGGGMDKETMSKIFDPFFTTKFTGRGLGMSAVQGIMQGHNGAIEVESEKGRGARFKIYIPVSETEKNITQKRLEDTARNWRGFGVVLLVDDEEPVRRVGKKMLESVGFSVVLAEDGIEALDLFKRRPAEFDLVLLDLTMPRMDGRECFTKLREIREDIDIVVISGYDNEEVSEKFSQQGMNGFIQKPFELSTLKRVLKGVKEQSANEHG